MDNLQASKNMSLNFSLINILIMLLGKERLRTRERKWDSLQPPKKMCWVGKQGKNLLLWGKLVVSWVTRIQGLFKDMCTPHDTHAGQCGRTLQREQCRGTGDPWKLQRWKWSGTGSHRWNDKTAKCQVWGKGRNEVWPKALLDTGQVPDSIWKQPWCHVLPQLPRPRPRRLSAETISPCLVWKN